MNEDTQVSSMRSKLMSEEAQDSSEIKVSMNERAPVSSMRRRGWMNEGAPVTSGEIS
jgi:hypothetical protein